MNSARAPDDRLPAAGATPGCFQGETAFRIDHGFRPARRTSPTLDGCRPSRSGYLPYVLLQNFRPERRDDCDTSCRNAVSPGRGKRDFVVSRSFSPDSCRRRPRRSTPAVDRFLSPRIALPIRRVLETPRSLPTPDPSSDLFPTATTHKQLESGSISFRSSVTNVHLPQCTFISPTRGMGYHRPSEEGQAPPRSPLKERPHPGRQFRRAISTRTRFEKGSKWPQTITA